MNIHVVPPKINHGTRPNKCDKSSTCHESKVLSHIIVAMHVRSALVQEHSYSLILVAVIAGLILNIKIVIVIRPK